MWMFGLLAAGLLQAASIAQAPLTPATAAILVNRSDDQYRPTLKQALADPDVAVRAVAARVAGVRHQGDMIPVLEGALAAEKAENDRRREEARRLLEDPSAIEDLARRELGLIKPGEKLFILKDVPPPAAKN